MFIFVQLRFYHDGSTYQYNNLSKLIEAIIKLSHHGLYLRLRTLREEISFTARPKIHYHSQFFKYGQSIFCQTHWLIFSDIFDLCLHWVSVVRGLYKLYIQLNPTKGWEQEWFFKRIVSHYDYASSTVHTTWIFIRHDQKNLAFKFILALFLRFQLYKGCSI